LFSREARKANRPASNEQYTWNHVGDVRGNEASQSCQEKQEGRHAGPRSGERAGDHADDGSAEGDPGTEKDRVGMLQAWSMGGRSEEDEWSGGNDQAQEAASHCQDRCRDAHGK
jgi:hypothetical protein